MGPDHEMSWTEVWQNSNVVGGASVSYKSFCDDGSGRRPGEDLDLTRGVNQHVPAQVIGQEKKG